jgi:hypothetical protein
MFLYEYKEETNFSLIKFQSMDDFQLVGPFHKMKS